jgi:hypothetical protein
MVPFARQMLTVIRPSQSTVLVTGEWLGPSP